jgi:eukaryotic-like serine/threonine-protein kinase
MSSTREGTPDRATGPRRSKVAILIAAVIILLPGLIAFVLYSHHRRSERPSADPNVAEGGHQALAADQRLALDGDLNQAVENYQKIVASYPQDYRAFDDLGAVYARLGEYNKALEVTRQAMNLAPNELAPYEHLGHYYTAIQHPDDGHQVIRDAQAKRMDSPAFHQVLYAQAFLAQTGADKPAMSDQIRWFAQRPEYESYGLALAAGTAAYGGHVAKSLDLTNRAVEAAIAANDKDAAGMWQESQALRSAAFGNAADAQKQAEAGLKLAPGNPEAVAEGALALAIIGDTSRAAALAQDLSKRRPHDTQMQSVWLPTIHAQMALQKKNAREALDDLAPALPLELGATTYGPNPTCMYSAYLRGQAYLADQKGAAAATEFQKILDHSGVVWNCWTGALAHLGLARANALLMQDVDGQEDVDEARLQAIMAYKDFLKLWKEGDPETPILQQAKEELAQIQQ